MTDLSAEQRTSNSVSSKTRRRRTVSPTLDFVAGYSWRILAVALTVAALVWLTGQLLLVVVPCAVAGLLARALWPIARFVRRRGMRPALAAAITVIGFIVVLTAALGLVGGSIAGEVDQLAPTVTEGVDDLTDWLVDDSPFDVSRTDVERVREQAADSLRSAAGSGGGVASGAIVAVELVVGSLLSLIITFFLLKDGRRWKDRLVAALPAERRVAADRSIVRGWEAAGGYLKGAAVLGIVEAIAIGLTLLLTGSSLVVPVMLITFLAAFVPIVGAVVAGVVATLVALVTAGTIPALVVAGVAVVVQQLDNDLLAPVIYGKALRLHPLVILLGIAAGGALFGFVGTFFAVPFLAVTMNAWSGYRGSADP